MSDLEDRGFVRVHCTACDRPDVWLKCDGCAKSDHFLFDGKQVGCDCGARYDHAVCLCGAQVPADQLTFVNWNDGPMGLADLEWDPRRLAVAGGVALLVVVVGVTLAWVLWT